MSIKIALTHRTSYRYDRDVELSPHIIRLRPAPHSRTPILSYSLKIQPEDHFINWQQDPFGNYQARFVFPKKTRFFEVLVDLTADMRVYNPFDFFVEGYAEKFPFKYTELLEKELAPYLNKIPLTPHFEKFFKTVDTTPREMNNFLVDLNQKVSADIRYIIRMEPGVQTCEETLQLGSGSCRDSAYLLVQTLRHLGLAARFVSGYLVQLKADTVPAEGPKGPETDFTDLHAWAEVYIPGAGWIGMDATSGLMAGEGHIPLACTPEPESAAAVTGFVSDGKSEFDFEMKVVRISETPRVTKPYSDDDWNSILELGSDIDRRIEKNQIHLTIGGEPTFVSTENREDNEWNFGAMGPNKYKISEKLIYKLKEKYSTNSLLQYCQGKWYPGELIPRWSINCYWRKDNEPIWKDFKLLATENEPGKNTVQDSSKFIEALANELRVSKKFILPAYEDIVYYIWKEATLPVTSEAELKKLNAFEKAERKRLLALLETGLKDEVGFVLPLEYNVIDKRFQSNQWTFERDKLYLIPGDSPIGFRLPLDSLNGSFESFPSEDPMAPKKDLPSRKELEDKRKSISEQKEQPEFRSKSALCVQVRNGNIRVFLPPMYNLESFLELIVAIEKASEITGLSIILEGYDPIRDTRLERFQITPDPGVIEVNLHPSSSFAEILGKTEILYETSETVKLTAEKFMLDGRHCGTGGGNHITVGAATPSESPFLKRPDLLRSLIAYWQNHPSLSYLFSGLFIGPTSQAPRIDEARIDSLHELEIAFRQIDSKDETTPWLLDRLFRNILVDVTGNTHRTEISIDKMFDPGSVTGRLGLVEFRAFEMPPHFKMSVVQQALVMSLINMFWEKPYRRSPIRWDTSLHDKFMLPYFVWKDFGEVISDLNREGFGFKESYFQPFYEFRFPEYGLHEADGLSLELRMALEPWNVLGEETNAFGTSRGVDSAVERVQILIRGLVPGRHLLSCNGYQVPLQPTGILGEYVAGVRFKAWEAVLTLHPHLPAQQSLVFDIYDQWNQRSVGGCTYHVSHPGGRTYETFPVNSYEAESRRISRFWSHGHNPGTTPQPIPKKLENSDFPCTLDLRML
ncbi:transglutaminase family protein [Leptospira sp. GIMC2001]|uniref:transglutaminase family protein n=1 Tax=Leptospira sp. GIMC2001 TaxID=1513297 RepID=UPI00234B8770|nr:transglutaminase family protein [Leptospira sp. GIMC2001]WCL49344.1 transglutaminase family protein [Leptospira sp. GIMC2001]